MTQAEFIIRPFDEARDHAGVRQCFIDLQDHEHAIYAEAPRGEAIVDAYLEWMFERVIRHAGAVFVACAEDALAGFATVLAHVPRTDPDDPQPEHALLSELSVSPAFRGRGIGRALIAAAERFAIEAGARVMRLSVVAENAGARRLYERLGFSELHVVLQKNF